MATSTVTVLDTVKAELAAHLGALLDAESVPKPATTGYLRGERELKATTTLPLVIVELDNFAQEGAVGGQGTRITHFNVWGVLAGPDEDTLIGYLATYMDLICKVLESEVAIGGAKPIVDGADADVTLRRGNALFRACYVQAHIRQYRARGES